MQREHRQLEPDADGQKGETGAYRARIGYLGQTRREVLHVQRSGHHVQKADPDQDERGADGAEEQVLQRRGQRPATLPETDQGIRGERGDLEEDEHVEQIAGDGDAQQSGQAEQVARVKPELLPLVALKGIGRARARVLFNSGFRSVDDLKRAPLPRLIGLPLIGPRLAQKIKEQVGGFVKEQEWKSLKKKKDTEKQRALTDF